jgi:LysR family nitrogen assimilation transcriptional regulator
VLAALKATYGSVEVREGLTLALSHDVLATSLDIALCYDFEPVERIHAVTLYDQHLALIGSPDLMQTLPDPIAFSDIEGVPLVLNAQAHAARRHLELLAANHGVRLQIDYGVDSIVVMKELLGNERCTIAPRGAFIDELRTATLRATTIDDPPVVLPLNLLLREDMPKATKAFFVRLFRNIVQAAIDAGELDWHSPTQPLHKPASLPRRP